MRKLYGRLMLLLLPLALAAAWQALPGSARAEEEPTFELVLREHRFEPATLEVPAGKRITLLVRNDDPTPEEFESRDLAVEKIVPGKFRIKVRIGPLEPGAYTFIGEFHEASAKGVLTAK